MKKLALLLVIASFASTANAGYGKIFQALYARDPITNLILYACFQPAAANNYVPNSALKNKLVSIPEHMAPMAGPVPVTALTTWFFQEERGMNFRGGANSGMHQADGYLVQQNGMPANSFPGMSAMLVAYDPAFQLGNPPLFHAGYTNCLALREIQ